MLRHILFIWRKEAGKDVRKQISTMRNQDKKRPTGAVSIRLARQRGLGAAPRRRPTGAVSIRLARQRGLASPPTGADDTSANQRGDAVFHVLKTFGGFRFSLTATPSRWTPRAESIRGRFSASSIWYACLAAVCSPNGECVIPRPLDAPLPPSI